VRKVPREFAGRRDGSCIVRYRERAGAERSLCRLERGRIATCDDHARTFCGKCLRLTRPMPLLPPVTSTVLPS
jgi:hypothetical protein